MQNDNIEIQKLYEDLNKDASESGFLREFNDLDLEIELYESHITGLASKFIKDSKVTKKMIEIDNKLSVQLDNCINRLQRLQK